MLMLSIIDLTYLRFNFRHSLIQQVNNCFTVFKIHFLTRQAMIPRVVFRCTHIIMSGFSSQLWLLHWLTPSTNQTSLVISCSFFILLNGRLAETTPDRK